MRKPLAFSILSLLISILSACAVTPERRDQPRAMPFAVVSCPGFSIDRLAWLAGTWVGDQQGISTEEVWLTPRGGTMIGMHRDIAADGEVFFEFLRIEDRAGTVVYVASPRGAAPTEFIHTGCVDGVAQFVNPAHDFPQRIVYHRLGEDSLKASVHGREEGEERSREWLWRRER